MLQVLDRMLRVDGESRVEADADSVKEAEREGDLVEDDALPSTTFTFSPRHYATTVFSAAAYSRRRHRRYSGAIPSNLPPASHRLIHKRFYMRCKRAEASGSIAQFDPARLKPG